jgi:hypothetical protein
MGILSTSQFQGSSRLALAVNRYGASVLECMCVGGGRGGGNSQVPFFQLTSSGKFKLSTAFLCVRGEKKLQSTIQQALHEQDPFFYPLKKSLP